MGDEAEGQFEQFCAENSVPYARLGLNRPPFDATQFRKIPKKIRQIPDYLAFVNGQPLFVECKGFSRYGLKIKQEALDSGLLWDKELDLVFFLYNNHNRRGYFIPVLTLDIHTALMQPLRFEVDNKEYYHLTSGDVERLAVSWREL